MEQAKIKNSSSQIKVFPLLTLVGFIMLTNCKEKNGNSSVSKSEIDSLRNQIAMLTAGNKEVEQNLVKFDTLDFVVFSNQEWTRFHESHHKDILVNWPDGHQTKGLEKHIEDLKAMFVYAPNTSIKFHPIRFGNGEWTCVTGVMKGTFTKPMPMPGGKVFQPTGKSFSISMCTVGHWKDGVMVEESLFWDNQTYMKQLGLTK